MEFRRAYDPLRAIGAAWQLGQTAPLPLWLGGLLLAVTDPSSSGVRIESGGQAEWIGVLGLAFGTCFCLGVAVWLAGCWIYLGVAGVVRRLAGGATSAEVSVADLFRGRGLVASMAVARLCKTGLMVLVGLPFFVMFFGPVWLGRWADLEIPGFPDSRTLGFLAGAVFSLAYVPIFAYVALGLALVEEVVAFDAKPPFEALARSWELARGNRPTLIVFWIATAILYVSGAFLCLVGLLVTAPWCRVVWLEAYARLSEGGAAPTQQPAWAEGAR